MFSAVVIIQNGDIATAAGSEADRGDSADVAIEGGADMDLLEQVGAGTGAITT